MASQTLTQMHQSAAPSLPGTWKLGAGRAISLRPTQDGAVRIAHGRIWATYDGPHAGPRNDLGDHVVGAGEQLWVRAGQRIVIQAWDRGTPAYFSWDPVAAPAAQPALTLAAVLQPLADLRLALVFGAGAAARLAAGLLRFGWEAVAVRSRETLANCADCALSAQPKAPRAHGAMS